MFNALNRFISRLDSQPSDEDQIAVKYGFQVLRNTNPTVPLEPWFNFIIGINGRSLENLDPHLFATEVRNCAGSSIHLGVWSAKGQQTREIYIPIALDDPVLGVSLQVNPLSETDHVWHILDVTPDSPADHAGLLPYGDYVIGSPVARIRGESGLSELIREYADRELSLHVYNHEYNVVRPVNIRPTRNWGGQGLLGCLLGYGHLHRIPAALDEPPAEPGETMYETNVPLAGREPEASTSPVEGLSEGRFLVPADLSPSTTITPSPKSRGPSSHHYQRTRHTGHQHSSSASAGILELLAEGEAKSKQEDHVPSGPKSVAPPPPRAGPGHKKNAASAEPGGVAGPENSQVSDLAEK